MKLNDRLYGNFDLKEKVLIDLINSDSLERLNDISQLGMPEEYLGIKGFSRYEHSIGVMLLLRKLGANLEEQVAGLIHDVSHLTFSHVIDWVVGDPTKEDYQDKIHKDFVKNSKDFEILKKYNLDVNFISELSNFSLLEKEAPSLCADRLDYSLRQINLNEKSLEEKDVSEIVNNLFVKDNQIVFLNVEIAEKFAREYTNLQNHQWAGDQARTRCYIFSNTLKKALEKNLICFDDFKKTESPLLEKLNNCDDEFIISNLSLLKKGFQVIYNKNGIELRKKFRYIDPEISLNGSYKRLSELSEKYKNLIEAEKIKKDEIRRVEIIPN